MPKFTAVDIHIPWWSRFWWIITTAILLAVAAGLIWVVTFPRSPFHSAAPCFDPPGTAPWPVPAAGGLGMGYLQVQVQPPNEMLFAHAGIDVLVVLPTPVLAIEAGVIVWEEGTDPNFLIAVESDSEPGTGYLYQHLMMSSLTKFMGESVAAGEKIGEVVQYTDADYNHLHLERVRGFHGGNAITSAGVAWEGAASYENPLRRLEPTSESITPVFLEHPQDAYLKSGQNCAEDMPSAGAWPFWFRESEKTDAPGKYHCPNKLPKGEKLDIVCKVEDQVLASDGLAISPCCVHVSIVHKLGIASEQTFDVLFDGGPLEGEGSNYFWSFLGDGVLDSGGVFSQPRTLYLIVTNQPASDGAWEPSESGDYKITIKIRDATGNVADRSMDVIVL